MLASRKSFPSLRYRAGAWHCSLTPSRQSVERSLNRTDGAAAGERFRVPNCVHIRRQAGVPVQGEVESNKDAAGSLENHRAKKFGAPGKKRAQGLTTSAAKS
jgi:hypothetical protein